MLIHPDLCQCSLIYMENHRNTIYMFCSQDLCLSPNRCQGDLRQTNFKEYMDSLCLGRCSMQRHELRQEDRDFGSFDMA